MAVTILEITQNSEEWIKAHEQKVSGSNSDVLLSRGLDEVLKQEFGSFQGNFYTKRGHILEGEAIEIYEGVHDIKVDRPGLVKNDNFPNAVCSPDGIDGVTLLEVKCFIEKKHLSIKSIADIPFKIMSQLQFNMMICELKMACLVLYNPDIEYAKLAYREIYVRANPIIQRNFKIKLRT